MMNSVHLGESAQRHITGCIVGSDGLHDLGGQLGVGMGLSQMASPTTAAGANHVVHIVLVGPDFEMIGVDAGAVVALVASELSRRQIATELHLQHQAMQTAIAPSEADLPIARCLAGHGYETITFPDGIGGMPRDEVSFGKCARDADACTHGDLHVCA